MPFTCDKCNLSFASPLKRRTHQCTNCWKRRRSCPVQQPPYCMTGTVPTVKAGQPIQKAAEYLERFGSDRSPVLFEQAVAGWPACKLWTDQYLEANLGTLDVSVSESGWFPDWEGKYTQQQMSWRQLRDCFASEAPGKPVHYAHGNHLPRSLREDCPTPAVLSGESVSRVRAVIERWQC